MSGARSGMSASLWARKCPPLFVAGGGGAGAVNQTEALLVLQVGVVAVVLGATGF